MRYWAAVVSGERYAAEQPYAFENLSVVTIEGDPDDSTGGRLDAAASPDGDGGPEPGDLVALVAAGSSPILFGLGRVRERAGTEVSIRYTHRLFDDLLQVQADLPPGFTAIAADDYARLAEQVDPDRRTDAERSEWFVSLTLPIEASTRAEAVREFWTYVDTLGPRELPAFVWPTGDEHAMQAIVLGTRVNLDPEEDDEPDSGEEGAGPH